MRRFLVIVLAVAVSTALVWAAGPASPPTDAARARQFQRDQDLIEKLVDGGIDLAGEEDPLRRATRCNELAGQLAGEIRQAGNARDRARVTELGEYLRTLLERGVADNLKEARITIRPGSARERKMRAFDKLVGEVEAQLDITPNVGTEEMTPARTAMRQAREEVKKAIAGKDGSPVDKRPRK